MSKLLLVGAGGHCRSVIDSITPKQYDNISIIDSTIQVGEKIYNIPVIGTDADIPRLRIEGYDFAFVAVGSVSNPSVRIKLYRMLDSEGYKFPALLDDTAIISQKALIEEGVFVGKGAIINSGVTIGCCSIINSGAVIDHDCKIGSFVHVAPGVCISGNVTIGDNSHIGIGSSVIQSITIGENTIIGAGSVVIGDIPPNVVAVGAPCKPFKVNEA